MTELKVDGLDKMIDRLDKAIKEFPDLRRELVETMGQEMLSRVQGKFGGHGKVAKWQGDFYGTKGGWAAVRPHAKTWVEYKNGNRYAVGHVTNAIESGHRTRMPSGKNQYYRPRAKKARVPGKHIYASEQTNLTTLARQKCQELLSKLEAMVEG